MTFAPVPLLLLPPVVLQIVQASSGDVSFSGAEIAVITALLGATVGAISLLFRSLLESKKETHKATQEELERVIAERDRLLELALSATVHAGNAVQKLTERPPRSQG